MQAPWLSPDVVHHFSHPDCAERRTWQEISRDLEGRHLFSTGSLGAAYTPAFRVWACWKQHPCLARVSTSQADSMCYVYHELENRWLPWGLKKELPLCNTGDDSGDIGSNSTGHESSDEDEYYGNMGNTTNGTNSTYYDESGDEDHYVDTSN